MIRSALDIVSAWASVLATTKSTPCSPLAIMLLTALPPAPPVPKTVIRGLSSRTSGIFRLMLMFASLSGHHRRRVGPVRRRPMGMWIESSEALAKPSSDPCDIATPCRHVPRSPRFEMLEMRRLRIDQQSRGDSECSSLCLLRQSGDAEWPSHSHRTAQDLRGQFGYTGELARSSGQYDAPARLGRERRCRQAIAHHFEYFLDARLDDAGEACARHKMRRLAFVTVDRRHGDHVALVGTAGKHAAVERFEAFGVGNARVEAAGQIHGHMPAA